MMSQETVQVGICVCHNNSSLVCVCTGWCEVGGVQYAPGFPVPSSDCNTW